MELVRKIGQHDILIETSEACGISLQDSLVSQLTVNDANQIEKSALLGILSDDGKYRPLYLHWELLDKCNFACPFCYIVGHSFNNVVRFKEIKPLLANLIREGLFICTLTGGESTIHPDFKTIYTFLKENGVIVEVFTNGLAIDDDIVDLFRLYPPYAVEITIYTLDNDRLRNVFGVKERHGASRVLENVLRLRQAGINVVCKSFPNSVTSADIESIVLWCKENEIDYYSSSDIIQAYDGSTDLRIFKLDETRPVSVPQETLQAAVCMPCKAKHYGCAIDASFSISPCPAIRIRDCTFDLRELGVSAALGGMKAFMHKFQDMQIRPQNDGSAGTASCMAFAKPVTNEACEITHFEQP